jgi:CelD/BcsL family acetyltransferase involved in cellulose biosynthesis
MQNLWREERAPVGCGRSTDIDSPCEKHIAAEVFESLDELAPMQQEWDDFIEAVGGEVFLTYDWCRTWWKYYGGKRHVRVFIFRHESTLVGIIPVFLEKIWLGPACVRAIKLVGTDFTLVTVSLPIHNDFLHEVLRIFLCELVSHYRWDVLCLGPFAGLFGKNKCEKVGCLCKEILGNGYNVQEKKCGVQTYFKLAGSWEDYIARLPKQQRYNIRRSYKAINSEGKELISTFASQENFPELFDNFVQMHEARWHGVGKGGHFQDWPNAHHFHREVAAVQLKRNRLRLLEVRLGDTPVGYKYCYKFADRYHSFLDARLVSQAVANLDLGKVILVEQVKKAIEENAKYIDSMQGMYEHKLHLGGETLPIHCILIFRSGMSAIMRIYICRGLFWLLDVCYNKIWFRRIAPRLPFERGPRWKAWIKSQILFS